VNQTEGATQLGKIHEQNRYKVNPGEPDRNVITELKDGKPVAENSSSVSLPLLPWSPFFTHEDPKIDIFFGNEFAYYCASLIRASESDNEKDSKGSIDKFLDLYNSGMLLPNIFKKLGYVSRRTFFRWKLALREGGIKNLVPTSGKKEFSKITQAEAYILLNSLLHQNKLKIGSAIKFTKTFLSYKKIPSPSSEATLRRYVEKFKATKYDIWIKAREGAKAFNDKCLPYAERNWRLLTVGEGLVADGHRLNFHVIDPFTGKPCRATVVLFWDWKSAYPLGWEIMLEENIQCIASALRNSILHLGKKPQWLLIDNGKAFRAKIFTSDIDLEDGIAYGMFATLGIHTHFAQAYNPQSKPVERFWGTFNNWFERLFPSYCGASISDKPAYMMRNEKEARRRHNSWIPKVEEVQRSMLEFREFYADQPSRGRDGLKPKEIFEAEKGPGVDPTELHYLMMTKEIKTVHRNGVTFNGWHYYDEAMSGYRGQVIARFSHTDYSQLLIYMPLTKSYCVAKPMEATHPMASESEFPRDREAVRRISKLKIGVKRKANNLLQLIESAQIKDIDFSRSPDVEKIVEVLKEREPKDKFISPFLEDAESNSIMELNGHEAEIGSDSDSPLSGSHFKEGYERYDWYFVQDPDELNIADLGWIDWYEEGYFGKDLEIESYQSYLKNLLSKRPAIPEKQRNGGSCQQDRKDYRLGNDPAIERKWKSIKDSIIIDPISNLSRPAEEFPNEDGSWRYKFYRGIEKRFPGTLSDGDWREIKKYQMGRDWERFYKEFEIYPLTRMESESGDAIASGQAESPEQPERPWFDDDYEKYNWLMAQGEAAFDEDDVIWIRKFLERSSLYKNAAKE
jgi:hypothetical protein